jgi:uncharacterized protein
MSTIKTIIATARIGAAAAILLMLASPGYAQKKPTSAEIDIAREIIIIKGISGAFDPLIPGVIEQNKNTLLGQNPALQKDLNEIAGQIRTELAPRIKEVLNEVATRYAGNFTEQELKDLLAFYKSPLGKKAALQEPRAVELGMNFAQDWARKFSDEVMTRLRAELKKKGHDL